MNAVAEVALFVFRFSIAMMQELVNFEICRNIGIRHKMTEKKVNECRSEGDL